MRSASRRSEWGGIFAMLLGLLGCGDDSPCEPGQRYSEKYKTCYSRQCPAGLIYDEPHNACRRPCESGFAYDRPTGVCYPCFDAAIQEGGAESTCPLPTYPEDAG